MGQTLYLMMGLPGAGKTTAATIIEKLTGAIRLTSDEARLALFNMPLFTEAEHQMLYDYLDDQTTHLLKTGKSVIYDANLNRKAHRQEKYKLARRLQVSVILIWVQTPHEIAKERAADESRKILWTPKESPESMFERVASSIETPDKSESYTSIDGTKISKEYIKTQLNL